MKRRAVLASGGCIVVAGCNALGRFDTASTTPETTTTPENSAVTAATRTAESSPPSTPTVASDLAVEKQYLFGEWHSWNEWRWTVASLELTTWFRVDDADRMFEMPGDQQLGIATVKITNTGSSRRGWAAGNFAFVLSGDTIVEPQRTFEHPSFRYEVDIARLRQVEHQYQFQTQALPVTAGETARMWLVAVLPRKVTRRDIQIGSDVRHDDAVLYPFRWDSS